MFCNYMFFFFSQKWIRFQFSWKVIENLLFFWCFFFRKKRRWSSETHRWLLNIWKSEFAAEAGVALIPAMRLTSAPDGYPEVNWSSTVYGARKLHANDLRRLNAEQSAKYTFVHIHCYQFICLFFQFLFFTFWIIWYLHTKSIDIIQPVADGSLLLSRVNRRVSYLGLWRNSNYWAGLSSKGKLKIWEN